MPGAQLSSWLKPLRSRTGRQIHYDAKSKPAISALTGNSRQKPNSACVSSSVGPRCEPRSSISHHKGSYMAPGLGLVRERRARLATLLIRIGTVNGGNSASQLDSLAVSSRRRRPDRHTAALLGVSSAKSLLVVERVSGLRGDPVHVATSWFGPAATAALDNHEAETTPPARLVAAKGFAIADVEQYVEAIPAVVDDAATFSVHEGACLLQVMRIAHGDDDSVIFLSRHRHPGDRVQLRIDLPTTDQPQGGHVGFIRVDQK